MLSLFLFVGFGAGPAGVPDPWEVARAHALEAQRRGDLESAGQQFRDALELAQQRGVRERFLSLEDLGQYYWQANQLRAAESRLRSALLLVEQAVGPDSPSRPVALTNLATVLRFSGAFDEAEQLIRRALPEFERLRMNADVARNWISLAEIDIARGDLQASAENLNKALTALASRGVPADDAADALLLISQNYLVLNRLDDAHSALRRAESIVAASLPDNAALAVGILDTSGALLFHRDRYAEAERDWKDAALRARRAGLTVIAPEVHLGQLYSSMREYDKADQILSPVLATHRLSGPTRAVAETELGWAALHRRNLDRADTLFRSAFADLNAIGMTHGNAMASLCARYARLQIARHDWTDALSSLQQAVTIGEKTGAADLRAWLLECADISKRLGDKKAASAYNLEAHSLRDPAARPTVDIRELEAANSKP